MAENPIRAALEVAARASARACWNENVQADRLPALIEAEWPQHVEGVAVIVAEFLRAMALHYEGDAAWIAAAPYRNLADAVARAAKGAGE